MLTRLICLLRGHDKVRVSMTGLWTLDTATFAEDPEGKNWACRRCREVVGLVK